MDLKHFFHFLFGIIGNAIVLLLFLAPVITYYRIIKRKSTEEFSGVPYISSLLKCLLSTWSIEIQGGAGATKATTRIPRRPRNDRDSQFEEPLVDTSLVNQLGRQSRQYAAEFHEVARQSFRRLRWQWEVVESMLSKLICTICNLFLKQVHLTSTTLLTHWRGLDASGTGDEDDATSLQGNERKINRFE